MKQTDVIVVGAGPVGTVAAYALARQGINVVICEAGPDCALDLRASTFHPPTLEILDELGVAESLIEYGLKAPVYQFRERETGEYVAFDLTEIADRTRFPFRLQCEQYVLARSLAQGLESHESATVLFNHRAVAFEQDDDGVVVSFETPYSIETIAAKYVVAADGGNSIIRKWLGAEFEGFTYPEKFLCLSTNEPLEDYFDDLAWVNYISDPDEWAVLLRAPTVWRILVPAAEDADDDELLSDEKKAKVFGGLIGKPDTVTEHRTIYGVHQRVVSRFDHGRVFLVGDAAHLNNPLGGFGLNSGVHDAWNLVDKIIHSMANGHDREAFELFGRQRKAVTHSFIQAQTIRNKELLDHGGAEDHDRRFAEMKGIQADPELRRDFLLRQAMILSLEEAASIS